MATAIVRLSTPDGFILAADGRECDFTSGKIMTEKRQKIFQVGKSSIAYSATGATMLGDRSDNLDVILFDLAAQLRARTSAIVVGDFVSLEDCVMSICLPIYEELKQASRGGEVDLPIGLDDGGRGEKILSVFFDGYFKDHAPRSMVVRFFHEGGIPGRPEFTEDFPPGGFYGSEWVHTQLVGGTALDRFKRPVPVESMQASPRLNESLAAAITYVEACSSPEAQAADCKFIGGRTHIAKITPSSGFEWIPGFEPATSYSSGS